MTATAVYAAGGVVWRVVDGRVLVLLIHRTKYRDITIPKGKVDPGETLPETAVREIREETGVRVHLGVPVGVSRYRMPRGREKVVHYWAAHASEEAIAASTFVPNREISGLEWLSIKKARKALSYPVDVEILDAFAALEDAGVVETFPVIVLRHAKAVARSDWKGADTDRPLAPRGRRQARSIAGPLAAFGPRRILSSPAERCLATVAPLATLLGRDVVRVKRMSQDAWDAGRADVRTVIGERVRQRKPLVLCSHRPVIPGIVGELALATGTLAGTHLDDAAALEPGAFSVAHLSVTNPGAGIVTIETHAPRV